MLRLQGLNVNLREMPSTTGEMLTMQEILIQEIHTLQEIRTLQETHTLQGVITTMVDIRIMIREILEATIDLTALEIIGTTETLQDKIIMIETDIHHSLDHLLTTIIHNIIIHKITTNVKTAAMTNIIVHMTTITGTKIVQIKTIITEETTTIIIEVVDEGVESTKITKEIDPTVTEAVTPTEMTATVLIHLWHHPGTDGIKAIHSLQRLLRHLFLENIIGHKTSIYLTLFLFYLYMYTFYFIICVKALILGDPHS